MRGLLLINRENGSSLKTYGVKPDGISSMKSAFIWIVIVGSLVASTSCDVESYPGLRFNFNNDRRPRVNYDRHNYYSKFRYQLPLEEYESDSEPRKLPDFEALPERIRQLKEIINWEKNQLNEYTNKRMHNTPVYRFNIEDSTFRKFTKPDVEYAQRIPILDEARMYPQEDDSRYDNDEEGDTREDNILDQTPFEEEFPENQKYAQSILRTTNDDMHHQEHASHDKALPSNRRLKNVKVVEDPTEFAYAPPNPMFYKNPDVPNTEGSHMIPNNAIKPLPEVLNSPTPRENVKVNQRSEFRYGGEGRSNGIENSMLAADNENEESSIRTGNLEVVAVKPEVSDVDSAGVYIIAVVAGISAAATVGLIAVGIGWYNLQKHAKNGSDVEYPAYGVTGPNRDISPTGERRLAQSAQMYHYQHQKQQIISMERVQPGERHGSLSDAESDEENEEGDYTVYECPGLAPTGEMEVKNPLFQDDPTPAQAPSVKPNNIEEKK